MGRSYISKKKKALVRKRANHCCEYCQCLEDFSPQTFSMEHIIPLSSEGTNEIANLALSCQTCNNHKYTKTQVFDKEKQKWISLYHPRNNIWTEHFKWNDDFTMILPLTSIGQVTIETLDLNRSNLINFRIALSLIGEHPPIYTL